MCNIQGLARMFCGHIPTLEMVELQAKYDALVAVTTPPSPPFPDQIEVLESGPLLALLTETFPTYRDKIFISDRQYLITSIDQIRVFIDWDNTNTFKYQAEIKDCDDFALALAGSFAKYPGWSGFPCTYVWGNYGIGPHAFAIVVAWPSLEERVPTLYFIEPQTDHEIAQETVEGMELMLLPM